MSLLSSKIEKVQSLLAELQYRFPDLPVESQKLSSSELERFAQKLAACLPASDGQSQEAQPFSCSPEIRPCEEQERNQPWLGLALEQSHSGAWEWDLVHGKTRWSPELYRLLGVDPAKDVSDSNTFLDMIHPDDREIAGRQIRDAIKMGGPFYFEFRILDSSGKVTWLSSAGTVEYDPAGRPIHAAGINQDITDRKRIEAALHESQARESAKVAELQTLMDAVPAVIWIARDPECKEMIGNRYGYEFLQMWAGANISKTAPDPDLSQQPYRNFKDGQEIPASELPMQIAASTGAGISNYEFDLVFKNGVTKSLLGNVLPLTDQNGQPAGAVAAFVDITERKHMENELRESEHRFRVALASAPMTVFTADRDLRYTWIYNTRHNLTEAQMIGRRDDEVFPPEDVAELIGLKRWVIETGRTIQQEIKMRVNGVWVSYVVALDPVLDPRGQVTGLVGASFDITTQRQLEAAQRENEIRMETQRHLLQSRENERVNIARDIHDGPLQTLSGMVLNIHNLAGKAANEAMNAALGSLESSLKAAIQELRQVVNQLRPPNLASFGLVAAIREHAQDVQKKTAGLDIVMDLDERANVLSDEASLVLYRVCQEALQNVIRHARATTAILGLSVDESHVTLVIKDNGIGFSVGSDFGDLVANKHYGLTGMKERVEAIGGIFQVLSAPGKGTAIKAIYPM